MTRQQIRKELRDIAKELTKVKKSKKYLLMVEYFRTLDPGDFALLKTNKHEDVAKQKEFDYFLDNMREVISLERRQEFLLTGKGKECERGQGADTRPHQGQISPAT